jgi:arsenate reductase
VPRQPATEFAGVFSRETINHHARARGHARSAGNGPWSTSELGLDISDDVPKPLTDEVVDAADAVVA